MNSFMFPTMSENVPLLFKSDEPTRHIAIVSKPTFSLLSQEDLVKEIQRSTTGEIRAIYQYSSFHRMIIVSYYSLLEAKLCLDFIEKRFRFEYHSYYAKPCCIHKNLNEKIFITLRNISNQLHSIKKFNYMDHLSRIGLIHSMSEAIITPSCIVINMEYEDERSSQKLFTQYDQSTVEGIQFHVYTAVNDRFSCTCHESYVSNHTVYHKDDTFLTASQPSNGYSYFSNSLFRIPNQKLTTHDNDSLPSPPLVSSPTYKDPEKNEVILSVSSSTSSSQISHSSSNEHTQAQNDYIDIRIINDIDLQKIENGQDKRTTFMIRNIPNKYTQQMLIDCINSTHKSTFDFIYLPIDFQNKCNVGYAFINFMDPKTVVSFTKERMGKKWKHFNSDKKFSLSYANIQGKKALVKKFKNSNVMSEDIAYRPKIFYSKGSNKGKDQDFPRPDFCNDDKPCVSHRRSSYKT